MWMRKRAEEKRKEVEDADGEKERKAVKRWQKKRKRERVEYTQMEKKPQIHFDG